MNFAEFSVISTEFSNLGLNLTNNDDKEAKEDRASLQLKERSILQFKRKIKSTIQKKDQFYNSKERSSLQFKRKINFYNSKVSE